EPLDLLWRHAHHREVAAAQANRPAYQGAVASEARLPDALGEDDDRMSTRRTVLFWKEEATGERAHSEHAEEVARHQKAGELLGTARGGQVDRGHEEGSEVGLVPVLV